VSSTKRVHYIASPLQSITLTYHNVWFQSKHYNIVVFTAVCVNSENKRSLENLDIDPGPT